MTWESLVNLLNSPVGKRLDRIAKRELINMVVPCVRGLVDGIADEILNQVTVMASSSVYGLVDEIADEISNQVNKNEV